MTLSVTISAAGISAPTYEEMLASLNTSFQAIYGADVYIEPDSQDGQFLALIASAINDNNDAAIAVYNSFSPTYAQGAGLASLVKINGIAKLASSYSTAVGDVVGVVGTVINNGVVRDDNGNLWNLPATVTIPVSGDISVTVTAQEAGAVVAPSGTINEINTPTFGWQTFTSTSAANPGAPVESDAELRDRQALSTALPALTPLGSTLGALANLSGVTRVRVYENYTDSPDADGIPGKSICVVIEGGDVEEIAETIGQKKTPGADTYGTTTQAYADPVTGIIYDINVYVLDYSTIEVVVTGTALTGYIASTADLIKTALADHITALAIGEDVDYSRLWSPAYLNGSVLNQTYRITAMTIQLPPGLAGVIDIDIDFNKAAVCLTTDVTVVIS